MAWLVRDALKTDAQAIINILNPIRHFFFNIITIIIIQLLLLIVIIIILRRRWFFVVCRLRRDPRTEMSAVPNALCGR